MKLQKATTDLIGSIYILENESPITTIEVTQLKLNCGKVLKYMDSFGEYRLYPFNRFYELNDTPKEVGQVENIIYNIETDQGDFRSLGFSNKKSLNLIADSVPVEHLTDYHLADIYTSPRVYLYIGNGTEFNDKEWILVSIKSKDNIIIPRKTNFVKVELTVEYSTNCITLM